MLRVTRRLPEAVERHLADTWRTTLNPDDRTLDRAALAEALTAGRIGGVGLAADPVGAVTKGKGAGRCPAYWNISHLSLVAKWRGER